MIRKVIAEPLGFPHQIAYKLSITFQGKH